MLNNEEQRMCATSMALFEVLGEKAKPQHNETILALHYCKLMREQGISGEESMGHLRLKANKCGHKEKDKRLKE